jgi:large subunit ribosomal protein L10
MINKAKKQEITDSLIAKFKKATGFYIVDFKGMTVEASIRFRRELKKKGIDYKIAKNTLIKRALKELEKSDMVPDEILKGQSGIIFSFDDPVSPVKIIKEQFDKYQIPLLKGTVIEGEYFAGSKLNMLAALPTKLDVMAAIVGSLQAPIGGIVGSINAVMRDLGSVIEESAKKRAA